VGITINGVEGCQVPSTVRSCTGSPGWRGGRGFESESRERSDSLKGEGILGGEKDAFFPQRRLSMFLCRVGEGRRQGEIMEAG
jgi:hypothetical protein